MFGKKPAPPPAPPAKPAAAPTPPPAPPKPSGWALLTLTADYAVMGYLAPTDAPLVGFLNISTQQSLLLSNGQMQALGAYSLAAETVAEVGLPKASVLAVAPRDEASMRAAQMQLAPAGSARAVLYVGPFLIRATPRLPGEAVLKNLYNIAGGAFFAVTDAEVHCQLPGAKFPDMKAPLLIINKAQVQVFHVG